jgi:DNA-3-methyladenine glycosylase
MGYLPIDVDFLRSNAVEVAPMLLGALIVQPSTGVRIRILETEAYTADDPASHSFGGLTNRNRTMFGDAGHWYVYFVYGMHWCLNVVTGHPSDGQAVLLRCGAVERGWPLVADRRKVAPSLTGAQRRAVTDGPAKLTVALGVDRSVDGSSCGPDGVLVLATDGGELPVDRQTARVGISAGVERPWRFCAVGAPARGFRPVI